MRHSEEEEEEWMLIYTSAPCAASPTGGFITRLMTVAGSLGATGAIVQTDGLPALPSDRHVYHIIDAQKIIYPKRGWKAGHSTSPFPRRS